MADNATFYTYINSGTKDTPARSATCYSMLNAGLLASPSRDAAFGMLINLGLALPPRSDVFQPQVGWGTPLRPENTVTIIPAAATAIAYSYEGDVT